MATTKLTKKAFIDALKSMTLLEINELVEGLKEEFGIDPTAVAVAGPAQASGPSAQAEEKDSFNVVLKDHGANKIAIIKIVRTVTGLGLAEAKTLVETAGAVIKEGLNKDDANKLLEELKANGATAELK